ncbi:MAG: SDR family NAD(P)-dependent oxidoreductase [Hyphomicrobiaceae bacterium]
MEKYRLAGRLALVTGASRGIGRAASLALAQAGAHVIIAARRVRALEALDDEIRALGGAATLVQLDLTAGEKLDVLGPTIYDRWGKLDIFVACAAILGPLSPLPHISADAWSTVLSTNIDANWRLIRSLDPLLRKSDAGRAIFVTCGAARQQRAYWGAYAVSKAALEALARTYAAEVVNTSVKVNLLDPGPTATELRAQAYPGETPTALTQPVDIQPLFLKLADTELVEHGELFAYESPISNERV